MNRLLSVEDVAVIRFIPRLVCLDATNAEVMAHFLNKLLDGHKPRHWAFDFYPVEFVAGEALGILVSLHKRVAATGGRLSLLNLRHDVYEVFEVTKLTQILRVQGEDGPDSCIRGVVTSS
jgi:anti-sigma B factor antagonist